jgi:uncharacterized protein YkwD
MAMGAVAVASGLIPGPAGIGDDSGYNDRVRSEGPSDAKSQGIASSLIPSPSSSSRGGPAPSHNGDRSRSASRAHPRKTPEPSGETGASRSSRTSESGGGGGGGENRGASGRPDATGTGSGRSQGDSPSATHHGTTTSAKPGTPAGAEAEVLSLVNQQREKAGCKPVSADPELATLAGSFSDDMADEGFFGHTSPDGESPWARAKRLGITDLGGENIARGQPTAQSVMDSWMKSPGHKANILNCQYRTLGVGAHFGDGGPWWTQDFGF